jgi:hypothetical protein
MGIQAPDPLIGDSLIANYITLAGMMHDVSTNMKDTYICLIDISSFPFEISQKRYYGSYNFVGTSIKDLIFYNDSSQFNLLILEYKAPLTPTPFASSIRSLSFYPIFGFGNYLTSFFPEIDAVFSSFAKENVTDILLTGINNYGEINIFKGNPNNIDSTICNNMLEEGVHVENTSDTFNLLPFIPIIESNHDDWNIEIIHGDFQIIMNICE